MKGGKDGFPKGFTENVKCLDTLPIGLKHRKEVPRAKLKGAPNQTLYS